MNDRFRMILVSDSHGDLESQGIRAILSREEASLLVHLGDMKENGGAADDFTFAAQLLDARPDLRFLHVNGGRDFGKDFLAALARHPDAKSRQVHAEDVFLFVHELGPRDEPPALDLWNRLRSFQVPPIACHGHTHRQALGRWAWPLPSERSLPEPHAFRKGEEIPLEARSAWCVNPGAFTQGEYAVISRSAAGITVRLQ